MPRIEKVANFEVGQKVLVGRGGRGDFEARALFADEEEATIRWFYQSDVDGSKWAYVDLERPLFFHPRTDVLDRTVRGNPCVGPFAFRPEDIRAAARPAEAEDAMPVGCEG